MSTGRLVINGKTWGEFESAKRIKGHIVISGYESYGGCHTVRGIKQPELNENQQIVLDWLKERFNETEIKASCTGYLWKLHQSYIDDEADEAGIAYEELSYEEESEVVRVFAEWVIEQGEEK